VNVRSALSDMAGRVRISSLDGLRGFAAANVAFSHFSNKTNALDSLFGQGGGQIGVMVFFCLSGYLMASLYMRSPCTIRAAMEFAQRRFARIGPLFLLVVGASALWTSALGSSWPLFDVAYGNHWFGLDDRVLWTIPIEVQFYVLFPLLWFLFSRSNTLLILAIVAFAAATETMPFAAMPTLPFFDLFFLAGICVALLPATRTKTADAVFVGCLGLSVLAYPKILHATLGVGSIEGDDFPFALWHAPGYLALATALVWSTANSRIAEWVLGNRAAVFLGTISYSVYLLHRPILLLLSENAVLRENPIFCFFLFTTITITLAMLSFRFIEYPMREAINRINMSRTRLSFRTS
jgi:peptidoglycan/LPS O-acetylase OafA/YrhL